MNESNNKAKHWTTSPEFVSGWWWIRVGDDLPEIGRVKVDASGEVRVKSFYREGVILPFIHGFWEWAGPIAEPIEAKKDSGNAAAAPNKPGRWVVLVDGKEQIMHVVDIDENRRHLFAIGENMCVRSVEWWSEVGGVEWVREESFTPPASDTREPSPPGS